MKPACGATIVTFFQWLGGWWRTVENVDSEIMVFVKATPSSQAEVLLDLGSEVDGRGGRVGEESDLEIRPYYEAADFGIA